MSKQGRSLARLSPKKTDRHRVVVTAISRKEARAVLTPGQYLHVTDLVKQLTGFGQRKFDSELRIEQFYDFWELKDKGGVLGKINFRVYFAFEQPENDVVILHSAKKEHDGKPESHLQYRLKNRLRLYRAGTLDDGLIIYKHQSLADEQSDELN